MRALAVAMDKRHPLLPDVPTFKELGVDWVDGAYRGIGVPKSTPPGRQKRMSDLWAALNADPEMKELAAKSGFELVNVGVDKMDAFMKERTRSTPKSPSAWGSAAASSGATGRETPALPRAGHARARQRPRPRSVALAAQASSAFR